MPDAHHKPNGRKRTHPFIYLLAVAVVFVVAVYVWDSEWPANLPVEVDSDTTLTMTVGALFIGTVLAMLGRLGLESVGEEPPPEPAGSLEADA